MENKTELFTRSFQASFLHNLHSNKTSRLIHISEGHVAFSHRHRRWWWRRVLHGPSIRNLVPALPSPDCMLGWFIALFILFHLGALSPRSLDKHRAAYVRLAVHVMHKLGVGFAAVGNWTDLGKGLQMNLHFKQ